MAEEEVDILTMRDDFYQDGKGKLRLLILVGMAAVALLIGIAVYLFASKPVPISFHVAEEWRIQKDVPLDVPYKSAPELLQWVSDAIPKALQYDFVNYNAQLKQSSQYFTSSGWKVFLNQLNNYVNYNNVQSSKLFVTAVPASAPFVLNQGLVSGRYGWWVQMPVTISYAGASPLAPQTLTLQVLVLRVPTLNNMSGVGIDNVIVLKGAGNSSIGNG